MGEGEGGDLPPTKAPSDSAAADFPAKKLARQLDFTGYGGASASVVLPEHPQSQPAAAAQTVPAPPPSQLLLPPPSQLLLPPQPPVVSVPGTPQPSVSSSARMV